MNNNTSNKFQPNWVSVPGDTIVDLLSEKKFSVSVLATRMDYNIEYVERILTGTEAITKEISYKLEQVLGFSSDFWLNREAQYREGLIKLKLEEDTFLKKLPLQDMIKYGWIKEGLKSKVQECLDFFNVPNISTWNNTYFEDISKVAFRTSMTFSAQPASIAAWIRQGEIVSSKIQCKNWNSELFKKALINVKQLTRVKNPSEFIPKLVQLCAECGVAVAIVPTPKGCPASGLTKFISAKRALLMLSFRYLTDDHFWFTFFHEAGHLLLHGHQSIFVEEITKDNSVNSMEDEANDFAAEQLIPYELRSQLMRISLSNKRSIIGFANLAGVSPGIVVGQLQHSGRIEYNKLNSYKRRYSWEEINANQ